MRRELPAEFKRDVERRQRQMKRAVAALKTARMAIQEIEDTGNLAADIEVEKAAESVAKALEILE